MRCCQDFAYVFFSLRVLTWEVATSSLRTFHSRTIVRINTVAGRGILLSAHIVILKQVQNFAYSFGPREVNNESFSVIPRFFSSLRLLNALRTRAQQGDSQNRIPPWENKPLYSKGHKKKDVGCRHICWKKKTAGRKLNGNFRTRSLNPFRIGSHASEIWSSFCKFLDIRPHKRLILESSKKPPHGRRSGEMGKTNALFTIMLLVFNYTWYSILFPVFLSLRVACFCLLLPRPQQLLI